MLLPSNYAKLSMEIELNLARNLGDSHASWPLCLSAVGPSASKLRLYRNNLQQHNQSYSIKTKVGPNRFNLHLFEPEHTLFDILI
jgi:hypothetical protein